MSVTQDTNQSAQLHEAATAAMARLQTDGVITPVVFITGRDNHVHEISSRGDTSEDEKDMTLECWLRSIECDAQALLSITIVKGRMADDNETKVRHYLMTASCTRGHDSQTEHWACMTELALAWRMVKTPIPVGEIVCTTDSMRELEENPTLYSFPLRRPVGPERADARRRLEAMAKRRAKGKRPFPDGFHARMGW